MLQIKSTNLQGKTFTLSPPKLNPFTTLYKCMQYAGGGGGGGGGGGKYGYFDVIMVLHIISYKIINCRDLHQYFSCLLATFGTMSEIMFSSDSISNFFQQLKIHKCLLSFTTALIWNGWEIIVFRNVRMTGISSFTISDSN